MAALIRRTLAAARVYAAFPFETPRKNVNTLAKFMRRRKPESLRKQGPKIYSVADSINARGYLRPQKEYIPPETVDEQLNTIFSSLKTTSDPEYEISDPTLRFRILDECFKSFQHGVPNSMLHTINKIGDVIMFYKTPVDIATPMDRYQNMDLPPNLHILFEYHRFDPEVDQMFGGVSAFPKSATIVSGLKTRKKYKSIRAQNWTKDWREHALGYTEWKD